MQHESIAPRPTDRVAISPAPHSVPNDSEAVWPFDTRWSAGSDGKGVLVVCIFVLAGGVDDALPDALSRVTTWPTTESLVTSIGSRLILVRLMNACLNRAVKSLELRRAISWASLPGDTQTPNSVSTLNSPTRRIGRYVVQEMPPSLSQILRKNTSWDGRSSASATDARKSLPCTMNWSVEFIPPTSISTAIYTVSGRGVAVELVRITPYCAGSEMLVVH